MHDRSRKSIVPLTLLLVFAIAVIGVYFFSKKGDKILSPIPSEPNFQVIYNTPVPSVSFISTPSATPKGQKEPTMTPKPKSTVTPKSSPTGE